jgi:hypothetical protein
MTTSSSSSGEGSVTFSLRELVRLEEERANEQRVAELRGRQAEESARATAEQQQRDEAARRELAERAGIEAARREVELRAAADERERQRRHEAELARMAQPAPAAAPEAIPQAEEPRPGKLLGALAITPSVVLGAALVAYFGVLAPSVRAEQARSSHEATSKDHESGELRARLGESEQTIASLRRDLARSEARVGMLEAPAATPAAHALPSPPTGGHATHKAKPPLLDCAPGSKDPLCGNLDP